MHHLHHAAAQLLAALLLLAGGCSAQTQNKADRLGKTAATSQSQQTEVPADGGAQMRERDLHL